MERSNTQGSTKQPPWALPSGQDPEQHPIPTKGEMFCLSDKQRGPEPAANACIMLMNPQLRLCKRKSPICWFQNTSPADKVWNISIV